MERIEQCGERMLIISGGTAQEVFLTDNSLYNGVNDYSLQGSTHSKASFQNKTLTLTVVPLLY